jgi:cytochrome c2
MIEKPLVYWRWLSIVALATIAGIWAVLPVVANAAGNDANAGQQLFQQKGCVACHTVGKGDLVGPDLKGVTARRPHDWLAQWIADPAAVLAKKDAYATSLLHKYHDVQMPNLGLSAADINSILAYLATTASGAGAQPAAPATQAKSEPAAEGNPEAGKALFTGATRFASGGPPCMACHSVGGIGALGGGHLGPDLTAVVSRLGGAAGVNAFVAGLPTPTMKAVWSQRPPTDQERANVIAFLAQAGLTQRPTQTIWQLAGLAVLGLLILLAIAGVRWEGRLKNGVWRPMVSKPTTGPGAFHRTIADEGGQHTGSYSGGWFPGPFHPGWMGRFTESGNDRPRGPTNAPRRRS